MQTIRLNNKQNDIISEFIAKKVVEYSKYEQVDGIYLNSFINPKTNKPQLHLTLILEYFRKNGTKINDNTEFKQEITSIPNIDNILFSVKSDSSINYTYSLMNFSKLSKRQIADSILLKDNEDNYYANYIDGIKKQYESYETSIAFEPPLNITKIKTKKQN